MTQDISLHGRLMRRATLYSVAVALVLIAVKFLAWLATDSLSLLSSLVDSLLDAFSSLVNLMAVRYALQPPDNEHRFGHTGAEDIAALAQSAFIAGSAIFIGFEAVARFFTPRPVGDEMVGVGVMVISLLASIGLVAYQRHVIRITGSVVVQADSMHYLSDILVNIAVILALGLSGWLGWLWADPLFALMIAAYIFYGAGKVGYTAFQNAMDREFPEEERQKIEALVRTQPQVRGLHQLKTRRSGIKPFIQFHLELDGNLTLRQAHAIADVLEKQLMEMFPGAEVIIHEDPVD